MKWQLIETAPKDGTRILGARIGSKFITNIYWGEKMYDKGEYQWKGWVGKTKPPTHWMPLPLPPKRED